MNKQQDLVRALYRLPLQTENQLIYNTFGYVRGFHTGSNKKYADLLRRALVSGKIARTELNIQNSQSKFYYYIPRS